MFNSLKIYHKKRKKNGKRYKKRAKNLSKKKPVIDEAKANSKKAFLNECAEKLNTNLPKSEQWFHELYKDFKDEHDLFNFPFHGKIPDIVNKKYKYIIEIDGSFHDSLEQRFKDKLKNKLFIRKNYCVFRVKAYCQPSFDKIIKRIVSIRECKLNHKVMLDWQKLNQISFNG